MRRINQIFLFLLCAFSLIGASLPTTKPEDVGLSSERLQRIHAMVLHHMDLGEITGAVVLVKNLDVPGVVGHIGTILGSHRINIANFSLGRRDSGEPQEAIAVVTTDTLVPQSVLDILMSNPAIKLARFVPAV